MYILIDGKSPPAGDRWGRTDNIRNFAYFIATHLRPDSVITWWDFEGTDCQPTYESLRAIADIYYPNVVPPMPLSHYGFVNVSNTSFVVRCAVAKLFKEVKPQRCGVTFKFTQMFGWQSFSINEEDELKVSTPYWHVAYNSRRMGKSSMVHRMIENGVFGDATLRFEIGKEFPVMETKTPEQLARSNREMGGSPFPLFPHQEEMFAWLKQSTAMAALTKTSGLFGTCLGPSRYRTRPSPIISPNFHEAYSAPMNLSDALIAGEAIHGPMQTIITLDSIPQPEFIKTKFPKVKK